MRKALMKILCELARKDKRIFLLTGDLGYGVLEPFAKEFPKRYLNVGVAEANLLTVAAGLSSAGYIPFVYSIATFITMRAFEQIRDDISLQDLNVKIIGVGGGLAYAKAGSTHHSIEDIGLMRLLGNMAIVNPCEPEEIAALLPQIIIFKGPMYIRLERNPNNPIHTNHSKHKIGKAEKLISGNSIAVLATGTKAEMAIKTAELCQKQGINPSVYAFPTIVPLDKNLLQDIVKKYKVIATIEEHSTQGGFGTAITEQLADCNKRIPVLRYGLRSEFLHKSASYDILMKEHGFTPERIVKSLLKFYKSNYSIKVRAEK